MVRPTPPPPPPPRRAPKAAAPALGVGVIVSDKYRLDRRLGQGGMGEVYLASHVELGRRVAMKFMRVNPTLGPEVRERFKREARAAATLTSEHIAQVFDVGETPDKTPYMVMEYLEGQDLETVLKERGTLPVAEVIDLLQQACAGVAVAHAAGIVHRDLKPANLFLVPRPNGPPLLKVLDFGIAKTTAEETASRSRSHLAAPDLSSSLTSAESVLGSVRYMAPEQMESAHDVDERADVWSLGVIGYRLLTGRYPFNGERFEQIFAAVHAVRPAPIWAIRSDVPTALAEAIDLCLQTDLRLRLPSIAALQTALARPIATGLAGGAAPWPSAPGAAARFVPPPPRVGAVTVTGTPRPGVTPAPPRSSIPAPPPPSVNPPSTKRSVAPPPAPPPPPAPAVSVAPIDPDATPPTGLPPVRPDMTGPPSVPPLSVPGSSTVPPPPPVPPRGSVVPPPPSVPPVSARSPSVVPPPPALPPRSPSLTSSSPGGPVSAPRPPALSSSSPGVVSTSPSSPGLPPSSQPRSPEATLPVMSPRVPARVLPVAPPKLGRSWVLGEWLGVGLLTVLIVGMVFGGVSLSRRRPSFASSVTVALASTGQGLDPALPRGDLHHAEPVDLLAFAQSRARELDPTAALRLVLVGRTEQGSVDLGSSAGSIRYLFGLPGDARHDIAVDVVAPGRFRAMKTPRDDGPPDARTAVREPHCKLAQAWRAVPAPGKVRWGSATYGLHPETWTLTASTDQGDVAVEVDGQTCEARGAPAASASARPAP